MTQIPCIHFTFFFLTDSIADPTITCKRFVPEGDPLNCECEARVVGDYPADFSLTWPGRSTNPTLDIPYVKRQHNGTTYICLLVWNGEKRTATYTLQVACQSVISVCDLVNTRYTSLFLPPYDDLKKNSFLRNWVVRGGIVIRVFNRQLARSGCTRAGSMS